ncbi:MAG TPA: M28 family peptidase, partial [Spirochaetia bacterium]|nr:M28 family peptidase [Spirochaetia bacterium]
QSAVSELVGRVDSGLDLPILFEGSPKEGYSDFYPFSQAGVPFLFLFTGYHKDYHQPGDHADKLDYPRMKSILRLAYGIVEQWAETRER